MKQIFKYAMMLLMVVAIASCGREESSGGGKNGIDGKNGVDGKNGRDGRDGRDGTRIYSGNGAPDVSLGNIGDFYIDKTNRELYGPKTANGWGTSVSIGGKNGKDGRDGRDGADGRNGADGRDGADGRNGEDGSKIWAGTEPPTANIGKVGDWYIDKKNKVLYGPKTDAGWGEGIQLGGNVQSFEVGQREITIRAGNRSVIKILHGSGDYTITPVGNNATIGISDDKNNITIAATTAGTMTFRITDNFYNKTIEVRVIVTAANIPVAQDYELSADKQTLVRWLNPNTTDTDLTADPNLRNVKTIGANAFSGHSNLQRITLPNGLQRIENTAFYKTSLTQISIPHSVTHIGDNAFRETKLTSVSLSNSLTHIGNNAFYNNKLTTINLPNSLTHIGNYAFADNQLTSISLSNSRVTHIGDAAFRNNKLTAITLPNSLTHIGGYAFTENQLTAITLPNSLTHIGDSAFRSNKLTSVSLNENLTHIGANAFINNQLTELTLPSSIVEIKIGAFIENPIVNITLKATTPPKIGHLALGDAFGSGVTIQNIYVPSASVDTYKNADGWRSYAYFIKAKP